MQEHMLLQRNLVYTGITRGKNMVAPAMLKLNGVNFTGCGGPAHAAKALTIHQEVFPVQTELVALQIHR